MEIVAIDGLLQLYVEGVLEPEIHTFIQRAQQRPTRSQEVAHFLASPS
jgi:hypothetical protein